LVIDPAALQAPCQHSGLKVGMDLLAGAAP
jgi:hypothetical protein